jgi:hypothetical protein
MPCPSPTYTGLRNDNTSFTNWSGRVTGPVNSWFEPNTLAELVSVVQMASSGGHRLHVVGSGWGFENIAYSPDWMVRLNRLNKPLMGVTSGALNAQWAAMQTAGADVLFHVEAGASVADVNDALAAAGLALPTLGGSNGQALAGAITTGTHGGDIALPPLAGLVMAMHLVTVDGRELWIERASAPITDDLALARTLSCGDTEILRNDDVFNALLIGFGRFGVIYSYVLRVQQAFRLAEWTTKVPGVVLTTMLRQGITNHTFLAPLLLNLPAPPAALGAIDVANPRSLEVVFDTNNLAMCYVKRRWLTNNAAADIGIADSANAMCLIGAPGVLAAAHATLLPFTGIPIWGAVIATGLASLSANLAANPGMTPGEMLAGVLQVCWSTSMGWLIPQLANVQFGLQYQDSVGAGKRGPSHLMLSGFRDQSLQNCFRADSIEPVFDAHAMGYTGFLDSVVQTAPSMKQAGYISLRWSATLPGTMSMHNFSSANAVAIEVTSLKNLPDNTAWMNLLESFAMAFGGRPHWGQINHSNGGVVAQSFGAAATTWKNTLGAAVGGSSIFSSAFTVQRGLEPPLAGAAPTIFGKKASDIIAAARPVKLPPYGGRIIQETPLKPIRPIGP